MDRILSLEPIPERLFVWGLIESVESIEVLGGDAETWLLSIDAIVTEHSKLMRSLGPANREALRRIVVLYTAGNHWPSPIRKAFESPMEGIWVRLRLAADGDGPLCEVEGPFPALSPSSEGSGVGAAPARRARLQWGRRATPAEQARNTARCLRLISSAGNPTATVAHHPTRAVPLPGKIRIVDAGQAHCAEIYDRSNPGQVLGYFDVGKPLNFFSATWPIPPPTLNIPQEGFVILSHWDYDHYSMALAFAPGLLNLEWIAPMPSSPSPTAAALIAMLGPKVSLIGAPNLVPFSGLTLHKGLGPAKDRNNSGYVLRVALENEDILLAGDVEYKYMAPGAMVGLSGILAPHHGAKQTLGPPPPLGGTGRVAFSFGHPNKYGHPDAGLISAHTAIGWAATATHWVAIPSLGPPGVAPPIVRQDYWF